MTSEEIERLFQEAEKATRTLEDCLQEEALRKEEKEARVREIIEERRRRKMLGVPERELRVLSGRILKLLEFSSGLSLVEISTHLDCPQSLCRKAILQLESEGRVTRTGEGVRGNSFRWKTPPGIKIINHHN